MADPGGGPGGLGLGPPFQNPAKYCSLAQPDSRAKVRLCETTQLLVLTAYTCKLIGETSIAGISAL